MEDFAVLLRLLQRFHHSEKIRLAVHIMILDLAGRDAVEQLSGALDFRLLDGLEV